MLIQRIKSIQRVEVLKVLAVLTLCLGAGCVVIPNDVTLIIESTPDGSVVNSSDGWRCSTPCEKTVRRDSNFDLRFTLNDHDTVAEFVEIPKFKRSRVGTYFGIGFGALLGFASIDTAEALTTMFLDVLGGGVVDETVYSTSERLASGVGGAIALGGLGFAVDQLIDRQRVKQPKRINVVLTKTRSSATTSQSDTTELVTSKDISMK